jgi:integrase
MNYKINKKYVIKDIMRETTKTEYQKTVERYKELKFLTPKERYEELKKKNISDGYIKVVISAFHYFFPDEENKIIIKEIRDKLNKKEKHVNKFKKIDWTKIIPPTGDDVNSVIKALYYYFIRRISDYAYMEYVDDKKMTNDENKNYYVANENKFIFQNYKTVGAYGRQEFIVPEKLKEIIEKYVKKNKIKSGDALLKYKHGKEFNRDNLRGRIERIFGVSIDGLRHAYITWLYKDSNKLYDIEDISYKLAHSVSTEISYLDKENKVKKCKKNKKL